MTDKRIKLVKKRDNSEVPFDYNRIKNAIFAAALEVGDGDEIRAWYLTDEVVARLTRDITAQPPAVEQIQDTVVAVLIKNGHKRIATTYQAYREEHTKRREEKKAALLASIKQHQAMITNEDGSQELFGMEKFIRALGYYCYDLPRVDAQDLVTEAVSNLYEGITVKELERSLINAARSRIELNVQYSLLAARLLLQTLYREILEVKIGSGKDKLKLRYRQGFSAYIHRGIEHNLLDPKLADYDLARLSAAIMPQRDMLFHFRGIQTVFDRYLLRVNLSEIIELPQYFWLRVAMGIALADKPADRNKRAIEYYNLISELLYVPSTPTLFNSGTVHPQLSSCFLNSVDDSLQAIFKSYSDNAALSKYAGGIGTDWTPVRALGSRIKGTNGRSQGVIPFLKIFNDVALAVNQGGKRKGAMCAYLELWHADIGEFIEAKKNTGDERRRLHDCHTAVWVPDLFMERLAAKGKWTLFSPSDTPDLHDLYGSAFKQRYEHYEQKKLPGAKEVEAVSLWRRLLTMVFETGHPWITFKDACNIRNPQSHVGVIHNSNLCTEITLNNSSTETAVCNLGSINLEKMVSLKTIDEKLLSSTIKTAMRMLDNVIDVNYYPTKEAKTSNFRHRPVGLGVMGYQDALYKMDYRFDSDEHLIFADRLFEKISFHAISASVDLARERGSYQTYPGSFWSRGIFPYDSLELLKKERQPNLSAANTSKPDLAATDLADVETEAWAQLKARVKKYGMRNSNCMAIAPTATISNIAGVYPCIEPVFRNIYVKENNDGSFIVVNPYLAKDLTRLGLWNQMMINQIKLHNGSIQRISEIPVEIRQKYKEAFEIAPAWILRAAAMRAKWIDQSQSLNIFMNEPDGKLLAETYRLAWELGLKTTYYLRSLSASQVTKTIVDYKAQPLAKREPAATSLATGDRGLNDQLCQLDDPDCEVCQ